MRDMHEENFILAVFGGLVHEDRVGVEGWKGYFYTGFHGSCYLILRDIAIKPEK